MNQTQVSTPAVATLKPKDPMSAFEARFVAQQIAFGPIVFHVAKSLINSGILKLLTDSLGEGVSRADIHAKTTMPYYSVKLLLDGGTVNGFLLNQGDRYYLSKLGHFLANDNMTKANFDFVNDICYEGFAYLEDSLRYEKPEGLRVFGDWGTIYDGISRLPEVAKKSWLKFDHYYSDGAFDSALPSVFSTKPKRVLDVGCNTGRFTRKCLAYDKDVTMGIYDLPGQIGMAYEQFDAEQQKRIIPHSGDILADDTRLPEGFDVIWMSQFLDCFDPDGIVKILSKAHKVMTEKSELFILETYCDRQKHEESKYCVVNTSFYFTCMANGNSRMYDSQDMMALVNKAGLKVVEDRDQVGFSHTLWRCVRA